jgi:hypothetical protein
MSCGCCCFLSQLSKNSSEQVKINTIWIKFCGNGTERFNTDNAWTLILHDSEAVGSHYHIFQILTICVPYIRYNITLPSNLQLCSRLPITFLITGYCTQNCNINIRCTCFSVARVRFYAWRVSDNTVLMRKYGPTKQKDAENYILYRLHNFYFSRNTARLVKSRGMAFAWHQACITCIRT